MLARVLLPPPGRRRVAVLALLVVGVLALEPALPSSADDPPATPSTLSLVDGVLSVTMGRDQLTTTLDDDQSGGTGVAGVTVVLQPTGEGGSDALGPVTASGCTEEASSTWFCPGATSVSYTGSPGADTVQAAGLAEPLTADLGDGDDYLDGGDGGNVVDAGPGDDFVEGGDDADVLEGGAGSDWLDGLGGDDVLRPGTGGFSVAGGLGTDTLDLSDLPAMDQPYSVLLDAQGSGEPGDDDGIYDVEDVVGPPLVPRLLVRGDAGPDHIVSRVGNGAPVTIDGGSGDDVIEAEGGPATVDGGKGDDTITTGDSDDTVTGGPGSDTISTGGGDDTVSAFDLVADHVDCGAGNDTVTADDLDVATACEHVTVVPPDLRWGSLRPTRVDPGGFFPLDFVNLSQFAVHVSTHISIHGLAAGGSTHPTSAFSHDDVGIRLSPAAMLFLRRHSWARASVTVVAAGDHRVTRLHQDVMLVAPTDTRANPLNPHNPLAGLPWAVFGGNDYWSTYLHAHGAVRDQLAKIALTPNATWFVKHYPAASVYSRVRQHIRRETRDHPGSLVQLTFFGLTPWEKDACDRPVTAADRAHDQAYVSAFVRAIHDTPAHVAVVVEPDGPYVGCSPHDYGFLHDQVRHLVKGLARLPEVTTYIDMASGDWFRGTTQKVVKYLLADDVKDADGFSLDVTHNDATGPEIEYGLKVAKALAARGAGGKHFVIDTSDNGTPFTGAAWRNHDPRRRGPWAAPACHRDHGHLCVTLGIPPTTDVASSRWHLTPTQRAIAARFCDAYLWIDRPWLKHQSSPFVLSMALAEIRHSPYAYN